MKKFLQFKIQVVLMKDISMLTFLLFAEMISVNGCVASYVSSVTVCKKKKKSQVGDQKHVQKLSNITWNLQDFLNIYLLFLNWSKNLSLNTLWRYWRRRCLIHFQCFFLQNLSLSSRWLNHNLQKISGKAIMNTFNYNF